MGFADGVTALDPRSPNPNARSSSKPSAASSAAAASAPSSRLGSSQVLEPGAEVGPRFRVEALLGQGGMGRVYKAYDKELDRMVALKVVQPDLVSDPDAALRFKQELLLASKISHKNILRIHDLGEAEGVKFISMAYVEGDDLHQRLKKQGHFPTDRAVHIARQLCEALEAAHAEGIVHRDLKPHNILMGAGDQVYVSDFGLAKSLESSLAAMTRTGALLGTPRYMSPEQVEGKPVDHRSDLYSLGLILYEMATGEVPFTGDSTLQVMYRRVKEKPKNPKLVNPDVPDSFARIIMHCLEKDPGARYQSAREILIDLDAARSGSSVRTRTLQIQVPELSRRTWLIGVGAVVALLVTLVVPGVRHLVLRRTSGTGGAVAGIPSLAQGKFVAVLPFRVLGDQSSLAYVADGLAEEISSKLFQLQGVRIASTAATAKVDPKKALAKIGGELGSNLIVSGTVQGAADRIRIIVNLENAAEGQRVWSQEFSGMSADLLTMEDQISSRLIDALQLRPTSEELARAEAHPTDNVAAYDLYLRGRNAMRSQQQVKSVEEAIGYFDQALKKDPRFALAYAGIADASLVMYREKKESFWSQKALAAAQQAQALNEKLPEAHVALGSVYLGTGKINEAIAQLKQALQLAPNSDDCYRRLGAAYLAQGQKEQAVQAYQKAIEINPYYWFNENALGNAYYQFGEYDKALSAYRRVTELEPNNAFGYMNAGVIQMQQGKYEESIIAFQKALELEPTADSYSNLGTAHFFLKRYDESVKMFEKAVVMNSNDQGLAGNLADAYRWSGQKEKAQATYEKAIALAYKELEVNPRDSDALGGLGLYYAKRGDFARGLEFIRRARSINPADVNLLYDQAIVENLANRPADALKSLRLAFEKGFSPAQAKADPELDKLRTNPECERLLNEFTHKPS